MLWASACEHDPRRPDPPLFPQLAALRASCFAAPFAAAPGAWAQAATDAPRPSGRGQQCRATSASRPTGSICARARAPSYPIAWVFQRTGLPVEVIQRVRGLAAGARCRRHGWLGAQQPAERPAHGTDPAVGGEGGPGASRLQATLRDDEQERRSRRGAGGGRRAGGIIGCEKGWCRVSVGNYRGYIEQTKLWGTYPNETIK